ncbi:MAG: hypothetical protein R2715_18630 [Ilumatobacteraceae bacterium]
MGSRRVPPPATRRPRALNAYLEHDRAVAGTFDEQLTFVVDQWRTVHASGGVCAINASSNDHVDTVNAAVQSARLAAAEVEGGRVAQIGGSEHAYIGDVVVTRRNDRHLTTDLGEPVRNRESWTVVGISDDGTLTVSSNGGAGRADLPAEYAREYVRLGYAATEHGIQGDTTTVSVELVSEATTRRGLYVGASRGHERNIIAVITESHDLEEARDILERVLANERRPARHRPTPPTRRRSPAGHAGATPTRAEVRSARVVRRTRRLDRRQRPEAGGD